jgi:hypothetical protein
MKGLTPYQGKEYRLRIFQSVGDIMQGMLSTHAQYLKEYDKIAARFDRGNTLETCKSLYNWMLSNTHYVIEPNDKQTLRSPGAILALGGSPKHGLDCKSYSLFIGGVLDALNRRGRKINWCYRFASYRLNDSLPHHVFVVVNPDTANEIFVDPVIQPFNYHKPYFYKIDKKPNTMALYSISGIGRKSPAKKAKREARKVIAKQKIKRAGKVVVKFAPLTVAARNSFLMLVKLNAFKLAENLAKAEAMRPGELKNFWEKLGGNWKSLVKNINIGGRKQGARIGLDPVVTPSLIATSIPILVKVREFLKKLGLNENDIKNLSKFSQQVVKKAIDKKAEQIADTEEEPIEFTPGGMMEEAADDMESPDVATEYEGNEGSDNAVGNIATSIKNNPLPWLVGIGAGIYLFKKL